MDNRCQAPANAFWCDSPCACCASKLDLTVRRVTLGGVCQTKVCCDPRKMRGLDNFPELLPEDKRWNFGWRAVRQVVCVHKESVRTRERKQERERK